MGPKISILYVDDEQLLLDLCRSYLEKSGGFTVEITGSAAEALEKTTAGQYNAIVSDYQMPGMDGIAFLKEVRSRHGEIPFILFTGKGREEIVIEAINNGADYYLQKGGDARPQFAELAHKIRKAVERKHAKDELRDYASQLGYLKASMDWASDEVYGMDFEGNILYVNDAACRNTGYSREEFLTMTLFDLDPEFTPEQMKRSLAILREKKTSVFTRRHRHKDGTIADVEIMANYVSKEGRDYSYAFARDITRRKQTEDALRENEERYQILAESSLDGILITDLAGRILTANQACHTMYEDGPGERLPGTLFEMIAPESADVVRREFSAMSPDRKGVIRSYTAITAQGKRLTIETLGNRILYRGEPATIISIRDVTARHQMEEQVRESEERYRRLIAQSFDAVVIHQGGVVVSANEAAARLVKAKSPGEMIGRPTLDFVDPSFMGIVGDRIKTMSETPGAAVPLIEERFRCLDGTTVDAEVIATAAVFQGTPGIQVVARDISGRKRTEEALRAANRQLNLLTSITRHDILNKIMVISGYLDLVQQEPLDQKVRDIMNVLESTTQSIHRHIEVTRIYQDLGSTESRWQALAQVLPSPAQIPAGVTLHADHAGIEVYADPILGTIFFNLLDNTLRHGCHATTIRVSARESPGGLAIIWEDNGIGIPLHEKEKIFRQGYGKNTGLGLFLTREILSITGITIRETGEPGHGARFEIQVPPGAYRFSPGGTGD